MELDKALDDIEVRIKELRHEYDLFFTGEIHIEPQKARDELRRLIRQVNAQHMGNTGMKFRFHSLQATFNSYQRLWDRILYQIEMGTYMPHRLKADRHVGTYDARTGTVKESDERRQHRPVEARPGNSNDIGDVKKLYREFLAARTVTAEKGRVTYDAFKRSLETQLPALKNRLGSRVRFKVSVEGGKAKVKGVRA
ncbi:MAG: hypothetical protein M5R36_08890 [Deltaproteobacteria bacterium]|nr:hypothetical protein [Deltaproteobacteria bacterium]